MTARGRFCYAGLAAAAALLLSACAAVDRQPDAQRAEQAREQITGGRQAQAEDDEEAEPPAPPAALEEALSAAPPVDPLALEGEQPRFDISADAVPVSDFFHGLVEGTPYNVVVHPDVEGKISLSLDDVSVPEVMATVRDTYGYEYQRTDVAYQILPARLESRLFDLDYLDIDRTGTSGTRISAGGVTASEGEGGGGDDSAGSRLSTESRSQLWSDIEEIVRRIIASDRSVAATGDGAAAEDGEAGSAGDGALQRGASVVASPAAGTVAVRATPSALARVEHFMDRLQRNLNRQVVLEARIVEVELSDAFETGIDWTAVSQSLRPGQAGEVLSGSLTDNGESLDNAFEFGVLSADVTVDQEGEVVREAPNFDGVITALEEQGDVQVLSAPRISTLNNQKALIKVGTDAYFQTDVDIDTQIQDDETLTEVDPTFEPFFSGIALDVTPSISEDEWITLHIQPSVTQVSQVPRTVETSNTTANFELAESDVRQVDSIVRARDDEIIVIGGLIEERSEQVTRRVPLLGRIPLLGWFFTNERQETEQFELAILLRPRVVQEGTWQEEVDEQLERIDELYEQD